ncbi:acyl-CoA dehydrogenase-like protein [Salegentibacter sp. 24]|uniref:acyl-CoA dehydrogenase family protein n=1 Tax=Salegentibacter sp. 24 TaxID=2183986 RepID=UPI0010608BD3|nr:acyl-CoA dehydrogenase family protein [Salegentibacter sp. 24]TDN88066.1 acyl-CoA dehydrogenase-like protein [Salegentibacter sp. 24]
MKEESKQQALRDLCLDCNIFPEQVLTWIADENLWNIWVPKKYGGLELTLTEGLIKLKQLAKIDGSLGWTITLCSGANYFIGNLETKTAKEIFQSSKTTIMGGSGGVFGKAEKLGEHYKISGTWRYATGASYLSHFTLNAEIQENGKTLLNEDRSPKVRSFVLPRKEVQIIEDWNTMGLKASATHSFAVENILVSKDYSFIYNEFNQPQDIFKVPFAVFADLSLWVNYLGMAEHFLDQARVIKSLNTSINLEESLNFYNKKIIRYSEDIEAKIITRESIDKYLIEEIHNSAVNAVKNISQNIIELYPFLGVNAGRLNHPLNQIFRDYFTATQHHIFTK